MTTEAAIRPEEFFEFVANPQMRVDPYPFYRRLQSLDPVHRIEMRFCPGTTTCPGGTARAVPDTSPSARVVRAGF
jgi:hypothetical protein